MLLFLEERQTDENMCNKINDWGITVYTVY